MNNRKINAMAFYVYAAHEISYLSFGLRIKKGKLRKLHRSGVLGQKSFLFYRVDSQ